jgi:hypothetical protein
MLARTPKATTKPKTVEDFETSLRVPDRPATIAAADEAWRRAVANREAGQARHVEAGQQYRSQRLGQPPALTQRDVDELGEALRELFAAEAQAAEVKDAARAGYAADVTAALVDPLAAYKDAVADSINALEELLAVGCKLHSAAVAARVTLPSTLPALAPRLVAQLQILRQLFNAAR